MNEKQLKHDSKVDRFRLEEAAEEQADFYRKYTKNGKKLTKKKLNLEKQLAELEARIDLKIREEYDGEKITEAAIKSRITLNKEVKKLRKQLVDAKVELLEQDRYRNIFEHRRSMIKYLAELYKDQYWSNNPYTREEVDEQFEKEMGGKKKRKENKLRKEI